MGDMGKVPYSVSKSTRVEFEDTERSFVALDQDFPIATRCTMATTGVVCGAIETEVSYYKVLSLRSIREAAPGLQVKSLFRESTVLNRLIQSEANATLDEAQLPPGS